MDSIKRLIGLRKPFSAFEVYPNLFQGSKIVNKEDLEKVKGLQIHTIVDLEGEYDPQMDFIDSYLFWPFFDLPFLPDLEILFCVASYCALTLKRHKKVLVHCSMGNNRSGLVCGRIMSLMGMKGTEIVMDINSKVPSALWNPVFRSYIEGLI